jgi:hypothetical protein
LAGVTIADCDGLTEVDTLAASTNLLLLDIVNNDALTHLPTFAGSRAEMGHVHIRNSAALVAGPSFPVLEELADASLSPETAELDISGNPVLESIGDFPRLRSVRRITLSDNAALASVNLPGLESLAGLRVQHNASLAQLQLGVQSSLDFIEITDNPNLASLVLGEPTGPLGRLLFTGNPTLPPSDAQNVLGLVGPETIIMQ